MLINEPILPIPGPNVCLRDRALKDLEATAHWLRPGHEWQKLDGPYYPDPEEESIPAIIALIKRAIEQGETAIPRKRLVIVRAETDTLLGTVSRYWIGEETNWLAIGITLYDPATWRSGLGFEALGLWSEHLFNTMPEIVRLDLRTWSGNVGMMRLAEKLGYQQEACFRKARIVNGAYYDGLGYGILREEWQARYPVGFMNEIMAM